MPWNSDSNLSSPFGTQWTFTTVGGVGAISTNLPPTSAIVSTLTYKNTTPIFFDSSKTQVFKTGIRKLDKLETITNYTSTFSKNTNQQAPTPSTNFNFTPLPKFLNFTSKSTTNDPDWSLFSSQDAGDFVDLATDTINIKNFNNNIDEHKIQIEIVSISLTAMLPTPTTPTTLYIDVLQDGNIYQTFSTTIPNIFNVIIQNTTGLDTNITYKLRSAVAMDVVSVVYYEVKGYLDVNDLTISLCVIQTATTQLKYQGFEQSMYVTFNSSNFVTLTSVYGVSNSAYQIPFGLISFTIGAKLKFRNSVLPYIKTILFEIFRKPVNSPVNNDSQDILIYQKIIDYSTITSSPPGTWLTIAGGQLTGANALGVDFYVPLLGQENNILPSLVSGQNINGVTYNYNLENAQGFLTFNNPSYNFGDKIYVKTKVILEPNFFDGVPIWPTFPLNFQIMSSSKLIIEETLKGMSFSTSPAGYDDLLQISLFTQSIPQSANTIYHYSKTASSYTSVDIIKYRANKRFNHTTQIGIKNIKFSEINWEVNGFSLADNDTTNYTTYSHGLGWKFLDSITTPTFTWFDSNSSDKWPVGGLSNQKQPDSIYRESNWLSRFIPFQYFNLQFSYVKASGDINDGIKIYLSDSKPDYGTLTSWESDSTTIIIATVSNTSPVQFYRVPGFKYITIVAGTANSSAQSYLAQISDLKIEGGYHPGNNELYNMTLPDLTTNIVNATYSAFVGVGNSVIGTPSIVINKITSRIGNGKFKKGIWENGVWNNGWRKDEIVEDFDEIDLAIKSLSDLRWRWRIIGPSTSVEKFSVGDDVSIGNIIAIDINGDRKLLKDKYKILAASASGISDRIGYITIESDTTFPYLTIERDSPNHKIKVTKNIWLSGAFLNGYFTGVWNYGLFKGYPLITEMFDTHWIDGKFEGGRLNSQGSTYPGFIDTYYTSGKVGLTFSTPHGLAVGDVITIDKTNKNINPQYDGETTIIEVPHDTLAVTDLDWGQNSSFESGSITTTLNSSVVQNMDFKSLNISKVTSNVSLDANVVFAYNSWMDLVYDETSATNIGKPQSLINPVSQKSYSENNLYGWITNDVLSSNSYFRDSFSIVTRGYKLGTKYKVFSDYIGDSGLFENYFNPAGTNSNSQTFLDQGWTYSWSNSQSITFSRTTDIGQELITGKELQIDAIGSGGILDLQLPSINVDNRNNAEIPKLRYTAVEFDLIQSKIITNGTEFDFNQVPSPFNEYKIENPPNFIGGPKGPPQYYPSIHFNNLNFVTRDVSYGSFGTYSNTLPASFLPINRNVNHILSSKLNKIEYFFNKRNLGMHFLGAFQYGILQTKFIIDNLKFVELDMIPFFQYFTEDNINIGVQIPYQGIAPFIDYNNSNFLFIDNINIGLDSFEVATQFELFSGVGLGVVDSSTGGGITLGSTGIYEDSVPESRLGFG